MYHDNKDCRITVRISSADLKLINEYLEDTCWPFSLSDYLRYAALREPIKSKNAH